SFEEEERERNEERQKARALSEIQHSIMHADSCTMRHLTCTNISVSASPRGEKGKHSYAYFQPWGGLLASKHRYRCRCRCRACHPISHSISISRSSPPTLLRHQASSGEPYSSVTCKFSTNP